MLATKAHWKESVREVRAREERARERKRERIARRKREELGKTSLISFPMALSSPLSMAAADDMHLHVRDGDALASLTPCTLYAWVSSLTRAFPAKPLFVPLTHIRN